MERSDLLTEGVLSPYLVFLMLCLLLGSLTRKKSLIEFNGASAFVIFRLNFAPKPTHKTFTVLSGALFD
jgi:hypothetical protein